MKIAEAVEKFGKHEFDFFIYSTNNKGESVVYIDGHLHVGEEIEEFYLKLTGKIKLLKLDVVGGMDDEPLVLGYDESAYAITLVDEDKQIYDINLMFGGYITVMLDECDIEVITEEEWGKNIYDFSDKE